MTPFTYHQQKALTAIRESDAVVVNDFDEFYAVRARDGTFIDRLKGQTARALIKRGVLVLGQPTAFFMGIEKPTYYLNSHPYDRPIVTPD